MLCATAQDRPVCGQRWYRPPTGVCGAAEGWVPGQAAVGPGSRAQVGAVWRLHSALGLRPGPECSPWEEGFSVMLMARPVQTSALDKGPRSPPGSSAHLCQVHGQGVALCCYAAAQRNPQENWACPGASWEPQGAWPYQVSCPRHVHLRAAQAVLGRDAEGTEVLSPPNSLSPRCVYGRCQGTWAWGRKRGSWASMEPFGDPCPSTWP